MARNNCGNLPITTGRLQSTCTRRMWVWVWWVLALSLGSHTGLSHLPVVVRADRDDVDNRLDAQLFPQGQPI